MNVDVAIVRRGPAGLALGLAAGLGVLFGAVTAQAYPLDQASIQAGEDRVVLRLEAASQTERIPCEVFSLDDPFRVVVDVYGADAPAAVPQPSHALVQEVRSSVWKDGPDGRVVRYVIETREPMDYEAKSSTGALEIVMRPRGADTPSSSAPPEAGTTDAAAAAKGDTASASNQSSGPSPDPVLKQDTAPSPSSPPSPDAAPKQDPVSSPSSATASTGSASAPSTATPSQDTVSNQDSAPSQAPGAEATKKRTRRGIFAEADDQPSKPTASETATTSTQADAAADKGTPATAPASTQANAATDKSTPAAATTSTQADAAAEKSASAAATTSTQADVAAGKGAPAAATPSTQAGAATEENTSAAPNTTTQAGAAAGESAPAAATPQGAAFAPNAAAKASSGPGWSTPQVAPDGDPAASQSSRASSAPKQDTAPPVGMADPQRKAPPQNTGASGGKLMNLDVQNADVQTVFRSIAAFGEANVVPDRDVTGPISIKVTNLPWRQALDVVCQAAGLIAVESKGVIRVATLRTYSAEQLEIESNARKREELLPLETHVFVVGYAFAGELSNSVQHILSDRGSVNFDARTNSLVVTDIPPRIADVSRLVRDLDTETLQVEITAKLVDVDATATRRLGIDWTVDNLGDAGEGLSISGGVDEGLQDPSGTLQFGLVRSWGNLDATLTALEQSNDASIISNPKITTINNSPASILVGKEIPLITLDEAGNPVTELKKVGITLRVTPFINADKRITMDLHPEISDLSSQATVQGGIIFVKSEAETRVMVEDGQTAVIGGLIRTNETRFVRGVPILKSIPVFGALFRSTDTVKENRELLIFVTPRIVEDVAER